jgi:hypothetical protein
VIAYELVLPYRNGVRIGPLGGIDQLVPFAPYDAIYRGAVVSSGPFFRLLCAFRIYDETTEIRRWLRERCEQHRIQDRSPQTPQLRQRNWLVLASLPKVLMELGEREIYLNASEITEMR